MVQLYKDYLKTLKLVFRYGIPHERKRIVLEYKEKFQDKHLRALKRKEDDVKEKIEILTSLDWQIPDPLAQGLYEHFILRNTKKLWLNKKYSAVWKRLINKVPIEVFLDYVKRRVEGK